LIHGASFLLDGVRRAKTTAVSKSSRDVRRTGLMPSVKLKTAVALAALLVVSAAGACSDNAGPEPPPITSLVGALVSDRIAAVAGVVQRGATVLSSAADGNEFVYATLLPGTAPQGSVASVRSVIAGSLVWTTVRDGGFDPVPISAAMGDTIEIQVRDALQALVHQERVAVAALRRPVVARVVPPPRKRDVPLNTSIVVVFSEPVAEGTLSSSIRLYRGAFPVPGTVRLLPGTGAEAVFIPSRPLGRNQDYRLIVTGGVRDLQGDALEAGSTTTFTTGQSSTGQAASITVSPDTVYMTSPTYQLAATVLDARGNLLVDQPVTWSSSDSTGLSVSPTGLVTARASGGFLVSATVNGLTAFTTVIVLAGPPGSMSISPTHDSVPAGGDMIDLTATVLDAAGRVVDYPSVTWTSSDSAVATVKGYDASNPVAYGTVTGVTPGIVTITATSGVTSATATVTVVAPRRVASVTVIPASLGLVVGATDQLTATLADADGRSIVGRPITWTTDDATVVTVDSSGRLAVVGAGSASLIATSEGISDTAAIAAALITFTSVSAFSTVTCGLTTDRAAYCWGSNGGSGVSALGTGSTSPGLTAPALVRGDLSFVALDGTCGLTGAGDAYCWGGNAIGQAGNGSWELVVDTPMLVRGGHVFSSITAGSNVTCGLTTDAAGYCWGSNAGGSLGIGTDVGPEPCIFGDACSTVPIAVIGGLTFVSLRSAGNHTCGLTNAGAAYCWGFSNQGQLGDGTMIEERPTPAVASGGLTYSSLSVAADHNCGLITTGEAYCWGANESGQLGDGSTTASAIPVAVAGGQTFAQLSSGYRFTCGVTTTGAAYCWGLGGLLGSGPIPSSSVPVAVEGALTFATVSAGGDHACGITTAGVAYCWGASAVGNGGPWPAPFIYVPVRVAGQPQP
jgi:alpha-tubulin suppressor-like RCC1 family protein